mmetsp:Transcript_15624/g.48625  ORF Transcript_15624/g.48625 Transcript_15624/m.48625 type:complete len:131 (-) Transcript_15624:14-406(-)
MTLRIPLASIDGPEGTPRDQRQRLRAEHAESLEGHLAAAGRYLAPSAPVMEAGRRRVERVRGLPDTADWVEAEAGAGSAGAAQAADENDTSAAVEDLPARQCSGGRSRGSPDQGFGRETPNGVEGSGQDA